MKEWKGKIKRLEQVVETMGAVTDWGQLRSSGRMGSTIADQLIAFGKEDNRVEELLPTSKAISLLIENQWHRSLQRQN